MSFAHVLGNPGITDGTYDPNGDTTRPILCSRLAAVPRSQRVAPFRASLLAGSSHMRADHGPAPEGSSRRCGGGIGAGPEDDGQPSARVQG
jgi:hypothetical protein